MSLNTLLNCLKASAVAAFLLFVQPASSQSKKPVGPPSLPELDSDIETRKKELGGDLVVYVANKDTVVYQKMTGDVTLRTQMPLGVASGWLTTALVLQLVDEGKLSLDDKVAQYLPVYASYSKNYITLRHCLTNLTGIRAEPFKASAISAKSKFQNLEEEAASLAKRDIEANAGEAYAFNPQNLNVVASIVEVVTKKKFEQLMRQRILTPLGMRNTTFATEDGSLALPAYTAKSTGADMIRFLQMILNGGTLGGKKILSEESVKEMRKVQVEQSRLKGLPRTVGGFGQGLSVWIVDDEKGMGEAANVLAVPGFTGAWLMVDFRKGYAFALLPKSFTGEQNANLYLGLKQVLDDEWRFGRK